MRGSLPPARWPVLEFPTFSPWATTTPRDDRFAMPMDDADTERLQQKLTELKSEHRDLDEIITRITENPPFDQIQVKRLKKRKLILKDQIAHIESELLPDIIA